MGLFMRELFTARDGIVQHRESTRVTPSLTDVCAYFYPISRSLARLNPIRSRVMI